MKEGLLRNRHLPFHKRHDHYMRRTYMKPIVKTRALVPWSLMIPISGQTTPEEADAKGHSWDMEETPLQDYRAWQSE